MPYLKFLYLVLRGEAVACDETGGDSHMLADFAVGGQRFGKHKHRGFRKSWLMSYDDNAGDVYFAIS